MVKKVRNFRQGEEELCTASWAKWRAQLKGLVELERKVSKHEAGDTSIE